MHFKLSMIGAIEYLKLKYMHDNPVKAGLCNFPEEYLFSSARNYILEDESAFKLDYLWK